MPTKSTAKTTKKKPSTKKVQPKKPAAKKSCFEGISMKNFLILWGCILAIVLLAVAVFNLLIPMAKAIEADRTAPSVVHMPSAEIEE